jgi:hypothetical protein
MKEFWYSLINANDTVPRIYIVAGGVLFVIGVVYNIFVLTVFRPPWQTIMVLAEIGAVIFPMIGVSAWLVYRWLRWQHKVVGPTMSFLERVVDIAVIGRIPKV